MKTLMTLMMLLIGTLTQAFAQDNSEIKKAIANKDITIVIDRIYPTGAPMISSSDGYTMKISKDVVDAALPYFGESHVAMYGGADEPGIRFDGCKVDIQNVKEKGRKKKNDDSQTWKFTAKSGSENVEVSVKIWSNGRAEINCMPANRTAISYQGDIQTED